jgi:hypothetical protein
MVVVESVILLVGFKTSLAWRHRLWRQCVSSKPCVRVFESLLTIPDALLAFAVINLALKVPRIKDPKTQQAAVIIWSVVLFGMYSFLLSVFRIKNGGYPFWLPPF